MPDEQAKLAETLDAQPCEPPKSRRSWWAFLWIGAAVLVAAGAAAAPIAAALRNSEEKRTIGALRAYAEAQLQFLHQSREAGHAGFAEDLAQLRGLLPPAMIAAHGPGGARYHGYLFQEGRTIAGQPVDWSQDFLLCATPAEYGLLHRRTFVIDTNGCAFGWDLGQSGFVHDRPDMSGQWSVDGADEEPQPVLPTPKYTPLNKP